MAASARNPPGHVHALAQRVVIVIQADEDHVLPSRWELRFLPAPDGAGVADRREGGDNRTDIEVGAMHDEDFGARISVRGQLPPGDLAQDRLAEWPEAYDHGVRRLVRVPGERVVGEQLPGGAVFKGEELQAQARCTVCPDAQGPEVAAQRKVGNERVCGQWLLLGFGELACQHRDVHIHGATAGANVELRGPGHSCGAQRGSVGRVTEHGQDVVPTRQGDRVVAGAHQDDLLALARAAIRPLAQVAGEG